MLRTFDPRTSFIECTQSEVLKVLSFRFDLCFLLQAHRNLAREGVRKSLVLLKNGKEGETPLLPLPKEATRILVAGAHAHNLGYQCGGWTINWLGFNGNNDTRGEL